jgi:hypothetical protein
MAKISNIVRFSLGTEELALALGMINRPDLGRKTLAAITGGKISSEEMNTRPRLGRYSLGGLGGSSPLTGASFVPSGEI